MSEIHDIKTTQLYSRHLQAGGKMVSFAGYLMPVQYSSGIMQEHLHTREQAGLFDVSHMGQFIVQGVGAALALEGLMPVDLEALAINQQTYATFTDVSGGISDDLIVTRWAEDTFFLIVNAACKAQDFQRLQVHLADSADIRLSELDLHSLVALQGPRAKDIMAELSSDAARLIFMHGCSASINGIDCYITRSGYTGEDGFEISVANHHADRLADILLAYDACQWIGLGARDSLRLESGLCLYGHDMDLNTTPVEAGLSWSISKSRRNNGAKQGGFLGEDTILAQLSAGVSKKRVGFLVSGKAPVREGSEIIDDQGTVIGIITSGGFGPTLQAPLAMGYVPIEYSKEGTALTALVRNKPRSIIVAKMPLVPQRYYRG